MTDIFSGSLKQGPVAEKYSNLRQKIVNSNDDNDLWNAFKDVLLFHGDLINRLCRSITTSTGEEIHLIIKSPEYCKIFGDIVYVIYCMKFSLDIVLPEIKSEIQTPDERCKYDFFVNLQSQCEVLVKNLISALGEENLIPTDDAVLVKWVKGALFIFQEISKKVAKISEDLIQYDDKIGVTMGDLC